MIATVILAMFFIPFFNALITTHKGSKILQDDVENIMLGLELIDQMKLVPLKYVKGIDEMEFIDGEQPLFNHFKTTSLYGMMKNNKKGLGKIEAILKFRLSKLPVGTRRIVRIDEIANFFAKFSVIIEFKTKDQKGREKLKTRTISGILVEN